MRALILKDIYVLLKQMKLFLIVMLIFACVFQEEAGSFIIFYATMLPITSMAYDEQSKWPQLALMLPYSIRDIVVSKYLLGWLLSAAAALIAMLATFISTDYFWIACIVFCVALCFMALMFPLIFWLGTEKGRLLLIALLAGIFGAVSAVGYISFSYGFNFPSEKKALLLILALAGVVLLNIISVNLSIKLYKRRLGQS